MVRTIGLAAAIGCTLAFTAGPGFAQGYPDKPVTYLIASSAGSSPDVIGRIMADGLSKTLGQPVVADDRPGAGGTVAGAIAADAPPDGYTILQINVNHTAGEELYPDLSYDLLGDFIPVARFASSFYVFVVPPSIEAQTFPEMIDLIKSKPGELNYASAGVGAATFMVTELLKSAAGLDLVHVPYNGGGPATQSIVAGETDFYGSPYATAKAFIEDGKLRALAVSSLERSPYLPDVPAASETVPGFDFTAWYGLVVPKGTPDDVVEKIRSSIAAALEDPDVKKRLEDQGYAPISDTPAEFGAFLKKDVETMAKLVRDNNLKP